MRPNYTCGTLVLPALSPASFFLNTGAFVEHLLKFAHFTLWHSCWAPLNCMFHIFVGRQIFKLCQFHIALWWGVFETSTVVAFCIAPSNHVLHYCRAPLSFLVRTLCWGGLYRKIGDQIALFLQIIPIRLTKKNSKWMMLQEVGH